MKCIRALYLGYEAERDHRTVTDKPWLDWILTVSYSLISRVCDYRQLADRYISIGGWQKGTCKRCGPMIFSPGNNRLIWETVWFSKTIEFPFMHMEIPCPAGYDGRLKCQYGDYMTPVNMSTTHGKLEIDLKHSYQELTDSKR